MDSQLPYIAPGVPQRFGEAPRNPEEVAQTPCEVLETLQRFHRARRGLHKPPRSATTPSRYATQNSRDSITRLGDSTKLRGGSTQPGKFHSILGRFRLPSRGLTNSVSIRKVFQNFRPAPTRLHQFGGELCQTLLQLLESLKEFAKALLGARGLSRQNEDQDPS